MLLLSENNKGFIRNLLIKIGFKNLQLRENKETNKNNSVERVVEYKKIYDTPNSIISEIDRIFSLENDTFISTNLQNENQLYNTFLVFCWKNKKDNDLLPEANLVEEKLKINKIDRLELQNRGIENKVLIKAKNNKVYFSKNFNSIEEVLNV